MKLRGIEFGPILGASGVQDFFGKGYWYHRPLKPFGLDFKGCTFVAKTTTLNPQQGHMPLTPDYTPKELKPQCIKVYPFKQIVLNAVGLSGPGAKVLFETERWQQRKEPFFISFMAVAKTLEGKLLELASFVELFKRHLRNFQAPVGLQINYSCPNVGVTHGDLVKEVKAGLKIASRLQIPLMPKFNILARHEEVKEITDDPNCDAICISNTLPWGSSGIDWKYYFGSEKSPLSDIDKNGGGLSGPLLFRMVDHWVYSARHHFNIQKPINAGGGIMRPDDVNRFKYSGASSVFIGSVAILRGWRVRSIIKRAHQIYN